MRPPSVKRRWYLLPTNCCRNPEKERYNALTSRDEKNAFVRQVLDNRIVPLGSTPIGLEYSNIDAQLLQGSYIAAHNYGWSEFDQENGFQASPF